MSAITTTAAPKSNQSIFEWISHHWFEIFLIVYGLWVWLPFLAPVFMNLGWSNAGKAIYFIYSFFCHQLPERSLFFFGEKTMYSLNEIQAVWQNTLNPLTLRKFIGNPEMGWKVAWSDRMISFYTSAWLFALLWHPFRRKVNPLSWWRFALLLLPMILDGGTHTIRDNNLWLATLTNNIFPPSFYAGDALGSLNSWMRLLSGLLAGLAIVWLALPYVFRMQALNQELDKLNYEKVLEQIKNKNPHHPS